MNLAARRLYGILDLGYVTAAAAPRILEAMLAGGVGIVGMDKFP